MISCLPCPASTTLMTRPRKGLPTIRPCVSRTRPRQWSPSGRSRAPRRSRDLQRVVQAMPSAFRTARAARARRCAPLRHRRRLREPRRQALRASASAVVADDAADDAGDRGGDKVRHARLHGVDAQRDRLADIAAEAFKKGSCFLGIRLAFSFQRRVMGGDKPFCQCCLRLGNSLGDQCADIGLRSRRAPACAGGRSRPGAG